MNYESIRSVMNQSGFMKSRETKKLEEFQSAGNHVVYLYKDQALVGAVQIVVHPSLAEAVFAGLAGIAANKRFPFRSGSNMIQFPKRQSSTASNPIPFGRSIQADSLDALGRLLRAVSGATVASAA